jgi:hypothetical protein
MPPSPKTPRRCLIADDEPQIGSLIRDALARQQQTTLRACSTLERIGFLQKPFSLSDLRRTIGRLVEPALRSR